MNFKMASWDNAIKLGTWGVILLSSFMSGLMIWLPPTNDGKTIFLLIILFLIIIYILGPRGYSIDSKGVTIKRLVGTFLIPYKNIHSVEIVKNVKLIRIIGNGGFFSHYGRYADADGTKVKVFATRFDHMVQLKTESEIYYISPSEPESFVQAIKYRMTE